jgi:tetratricopeptide (TPR) repeat protein
VYSNAAVANFITDHFVPVRVHVRDQKDDYERLGGRFGVHWTPTVLTLDQTGAERNRMEGFLPADEFLALLKLGLARAAFERGDLEEAERWYREVVEEHPGTEAAAQAMYWEGAARYKATGEGTALSATASRLAKAYPDSPWARKASVWATPADATTPNEK